VKDHFSPIVLWSGFGGTHPTIDKCVDTILLIQLRPTLSLVGFSSVLESSPLKMYTSEFGSVASVRVSSIMAVKISYLYWVNGLLSICPYTHLIFYIYLLPSLMLINQFFFKGFLFLYMVSELSLSIIIFSKILAITKILPATKNFNSSHQPSTSSLLLIFLFFL